MEKKELKSGKTKYGRGFNLKSAALILLFMGLVFISLTLVGQAAQGGTIDEKKAIETGFSHLKAKSSELGIQDASAEFRVRRVSGDDLGMTHIRVDQVYNGVPVFGGQLVIHIRNDGTLNSITGYYRAGIKSDINPGLTPQAGKQKALDFFSGKVTNDPDAELMLYPVNNELILVYRVAMEDLSEPRRIVAFVDASSGEIVGSYDDLQTPAVSGLSQGHQAGADQASPALGIGTAAVSPAVGTGRSLYSGTVTLQTVTNSVKYFLVDSTKGTGTKATGYTRTNDMNGKFFGSGTLFSDADNLWGSGTTGDRATVGVDAQFGAAMTWDYYMNNYGRKGIFNDSVGSLSKVHYGSRYNNAFWSSSCKCMTYGDGDGVTFSPLVGLDVAGHEMTHGVTESVAGLIYSGESGGLNEAMSDIFGTMVEYYASTHGATTTPDYLIGEDIYTPAIPGDALRYMKNPTIDGYSIDTYLDYYPGIDVHYSSGIANNAFYLLAEGGTHRLGGVVTGIGKDKAEKIFFRALDKYMIPSETFSQARADTIRAATDLYGAGSQEVTSVNQAWNAVAVY